MVGLVGAVLVIILAACSTPPPPGEPVPGPPGSKAQPAGLVQTRHPVTVLDDGDGPELCLGMIMASLPPQCGGLKLIGWDWAEWRDAYADQAGVRWGEFEVVGEYDPDAGTFTVVEATAAGDRKWSADGTPMDFTSPCPEPEGGWRVLDPERADQESLDAVLSHAALLDGYAGAWVDQSPNPAFGQPTDDATGEAEMAMNDPLLLIVNVKVTGSIADAEAALREEWGGMLCVSQALRTEAELIEIVEGFTYDGDGVLSSGVDVVRQRVEVSVVYDDGTLQAEMDAAHGPGTVLVSSQLVPVESADR